LNQYSWNLLPPIPAGHPLITPETPPLISQLLYNRGITKPSQVEMFLNSDKHLSADPYLLPDIHPAITRIYRALLSTEKIAVFGDFDVDGITSTVLLVKGLEALGANVIPYIPHRLMEGHGLNSPALDKLQKRGISLVITVDCGVTDIPQVIKAKKGGLDIIITDHHTPFEELPPAIAVINPKRGDSCYPFSELSGVGVAFKVLQALYRSMDKEEVLDRSLDLVALGTVADMMPMLGENRYFVTRGLELLREYPRMGIKEMADSVKLDISNISAEDISWIIAPRLNAAGRLENATSSYDILITDRPEEAQELASFLQQKNIERQRLTNIALTKARKEILSNEIPSLLIVSDVEYQGGILGLIAGKLSNEFYRPSIAIKIDDRFSYGSCRSIPELNIIQVISKCSNLLTHFGGHSQAAGFSLPTENLTRFKQQISQLIADELVGVPLHPKLDIDIEVTLDALNLTTYQTIQLLAPFGQGNPFATFLSRCVKVADCLTMGNNGDHLRLKLKQGNTTWDAVAFGLGNCISNIQSDINIVYNLEMNKWGKDNNLRLNILDLSTIN
jgi:single-stranded-DNA-specific exonuclease